MCVCVRERERERESARERESECARAVHLQTIRLRYCIVVQFSHCSAQQRTFLHITTHYNSLRLRSAISSAIILIRTCHRHSDAIGLKGEDKNGHVGEVKGGVQYLKKENVSDYGNTRR